MANLPKTSDPAHAHLAARLAKEGQETSDGGDNNGADETDALPPSVREGRSKYQPNYDFTIDLPEGEEGENTIAFLLHMEQGQLIEAKRDFTVSDTGNVAVEYEDNGHPSGIARTRSVWWGILLNGEKYNGEAIVLIRTERLKEICRPYYGTARDVSGGDNGSARMILLPVEELLAP